MKHIRSLFSALPIFSTVRRCLVYVCAWALAALALPLSAHAGAEPPVSVTAPAGWIQPVATPAEFSVPRDDIWHGVYYLLVNRQARVTAAGVETYYQQAAKAVSETGVDQIANIAVDFDPDYQTLVLHSVDVVRAGERSSRLHPERIRLLHRASSLEQRIFDNTQTASLFLDDIQAGDIVEYAYTLRGANPVFGDRHFGFFTMQWGVPVAKSTARLLVADDLAVQMAQHNLPSPAEPRVREGYLEYRWAQRDVAARFIPDDAPDWYRPLPRIEWSLYDDWQTVAHWAEPLYSAPSPAPVAVRELAERIQREYSGDEERLLAALRFVQGEVRYLSVSLGVHSHAPHDPNLVLERRFGDCKDKTLLLLTLLAELDIPARPALVNTWLRRGVRERLPSPGAFDHVLATVELHGRRYWLDPTLTLQPSPLDALAQPNFGYALVVDPDTRELTSALPDDGGAWIETIEATLDLSGAIDEPVSYDISIQYEGRSAEWARRTMDTTNRTELQRGYLNFYAQHYPAIERTRALSAEDDPQRNRVVLAEQYAIEDFWTEPDADGGVTGSILVPDISRYLWGTSNTVREDPYALFYPFRATQTTRIALSGLWTIDPEQHRIEDPHFVFLRSITLDGSILTIVDHYETLSDHVPPEAIREFTANLKRARDSMEYGLIQYPDSASSAADTGIPEFGRWNWPILFFALTVLVLSGAAANWVYRLDPPPPTHVNDRLAGIAGWLILPAIGTVLTPFIIGYHIWVDIDVYGPEIWYRVTHPDSPNYAFVWRPILLFELAINLFLLVLSLLLLVTFFQRRRIAPRLFIAQLVLRLLVQLVGLWYISAFPELGIDEADKAEQMKELRRAFTTLSIWVPYFLVSRRVRSTFTRGWKDPGLEPNVPGTDGSVR